MPGGGYRLSAQAELRPHPELAIHIAELRPEILSDYEAELIARSSPLMNTPRSREQVLNHAGQLLDEIVEELSGGRRGEGGTLASDIGTSRAAQGFHPGESLQAAGVLFGILMRAARDRAADQTDLTEGLLAVALTSNIVIVRAIGEAADTYARFLLNRIHSAQVEERRRLSRELHDRIGHGVSLAQRNLELYNIYRAVDPAEAHDRTVVALESLQQTMTSIPRVIADLRLAGTRDGLEQELERYLASVALSGLQAYVEVNGDEHWAAPEVRDEVFLILREALRNVIRHAQAQYVLVRVDVTPDQVRAVVRDDGVGFEPADTRHGRTGLISMRERIALLDGVVSLTSSPGRGTSIEFVVPVRKA